jgi:uncharacterized membrane protein
MRTSGFGHLLFAISAAGLAVLSLAYGNFGPLLGPLPASLPFAKTLALVLGLVLLAASAALLFARTARAGAITLAAYGLFWTLSQVPPPWHKPGDVGAWYGVCEALSCLVGAWTLYALVCGQGGAPRASGVAGERALRVGRALFGAACVEFGVAHFTFAAYTASMVPAWLPGPWALTYVTGALHVAAGLGLLFGILPRLAATLEGVMMALFGLMVWLPSYFARPTPVWAASVQSRWSETLLTFLLAASALLVARSLRDAPRRSTARAA